MASSKTDSPTTILSWTNAIAHALEAEGINSEKLFSKAGIPYCANVAPNDRIEAYKISKLLRLSVDATEDPAFGLSVVPYLHAGHFQVLGYSLFTSSTLYDFCQRLVRFFRLVSDSSQHHLKEEKDCYVLIIEITNPEVAVETVDAWVGAIIHFCRTLYRPDFAPLQVELMRPAPHNSREDYDRFFKAPITFGAHRNALHVDKQVMFEPLATANQELARRNDEVIIAHLARLDRENIVRQVEVKIIELLPTGECTREKVASLLNMSSRTLLNKLEAKDTSYKAILENLRATLAQQYIEQEHLPISEITYLLGFSDTSSFSRAFRRWTGHSPSNFRVKKSPA